MITQKTIQEVINIAKVEEVVGDFVNLRRRGVNMIGNCPFHDEKTPSFTVSPAKNIYKCFGCGKGGDPVRFVMDHEKLSFPEAIRYLASRYRIEVEETEDTQEQKEQKLVTDSLYIVNDFARDHYVNNLFNRSEGKNIGLSYFKERGFLEATIRKFELGYALDEKDDLTRMAISKKYNVEHLHTLGLTTKSDADFFRSRVMFTIHNVSGKVVAFAGRTLSSDKKIPKYINSPESEIYNKRAVLYGLYFAREAIRKADECILVEGYTDVISLHQGQIENVVASSGTSLTKDQVSLIRRYTPNIKIIYDGDPAGIKAALRGLDLVLESGMNVRLVLLPDGHDPDSFLALKGTDGFRKYLAENEEDFVFFKTRVLMEEAGKDPIKKSIVIRDIVASIAKIHDTFARTLYIRQCSDMLQISENIFVNEVNKVIRAEIKKLKEENHPQEHHEPPAAEEEWLKTRPSLSEAGPPSFALNDAWQERSVCSILINFGDKIIDEAQNVSLAAWTFENTKEILNYFDVDLYKKIITLSGEALEQGLVPDHKWYLNTEDTEVSDFAINVLTTPYVYANWERKDMFLQTQKLPEENFVRDAESAMLRLQLRKSNKIITELQAWFLDKENIDEFSEDYLVNLKVLQVLLERRNELAEKLGTVTL